MATSNSLDGRFAQGPDRRPRARSDLLTAESAAAEELEAGLEDLIAIEVEELPAPVAPKLAPLLRRQLRRRVRDDAGLSPSGLAAELDSWIEARMDALLGAMARGTAESIAADAEGLERVYRERIARAARNSDAGREILGLLEGLEPRAPRPSGSLPAIPPIGRLRRRVPGPPGRRLVRRAAERRLLKGLEAGAASVRAELATRTRETGAAYRRQVRALLEETVG
ncbi:MAG: hypothetical protein QM729_01365 [Solirubrobacterales bacterium]